MYRLFSVLALIFFASGDPRAPKIYNVLISSKKNLSPSHALPVYQPVVRTAFGLSPFFYQSPFAFEPSFVGGLPAAKNENEEIERGLQPLPLEQFIPYSYTPPQIQQDRGYYPEKTEIQKEDDPKNVIANLKKNPEIPDVPPPALPTRNKA